MGNVDLIGALFNALPMLLLIVVWIFFMLRVRSGGFQSKYQTACLDQMVANTKALERIAVALEKNASEPAN